MGPISLIEKRLGLDLGVGKEDFLLGLVILKLLTSALS